MRNDPGRMQVESMRISAESKLRQQPGAKYSGGSSAKSLVIRLAVLIAIIVAFFWWVYS